MWIILKWTWQASHFEWHPVWLRKLSKVLLFCMRVGKSRFNSIVGNGQTIIRQ